MNNIKNLCHKYGLKENSFKITKLKGDASDRKIYRVIPNDNKNNSIIAIEGSNINENIAFLEFTKNFKDNSFNTPKILHVSDDKKYYLLEDLGNTTVKDKCDIFYKEKQLDKIESLYTEIIKLLPQIQIKLSNKIDYNKYCYQYESFDKNNILEDIKLFEEYYILKNDENENSYYKTSDFKKFVTNLINDITNLTNSIPSFFLYRDFQTRNIMLKNNKIYYIDYQSGRKGLPFYDLASFLYSSSSYIDENLENKLIDTYLISFNKILEENRGLFDKDIDKIKSTLGLNNKNKFKKHLYAFGIIRIMQAIGRYFYLYEVKEKKEYIDKAPQALKTLKYLIEKYKE